MENRKSKIEEDIISEKDRAEIIRLAQIALRNTELLIQACDGWLPAEEGNENMTKAYWERQKVKRRRWWRKALKRFRIKLKYNELEEKYIYVVNDVRYEGWIG